jgi:hypothetical protein
LLDAYLFRGVRYVYAATLEERRQCIQTRIKITKLDTQAAADHCCQEQSQSQHQLPHRAPEYATASTSDSVAGTAAAT